MIKLKQLEYHVVDACNLACEFCSHYSNFKGEANLVNIDATIIEWERWSKVIQPERFHIIGGEPLLHPQITELVKAAFRIWNNSLICLYTNGLLLRNHPELRAAMSNGVVELGMHLSYLQNIDILKAAQNYFTGWNVTVNAVPNQSGWVAFYQFEDNKPIPFNDNNQKASWKNCVAAQQRCFVLRHNKLWKCPQVAFADRANVQHWFEDYNACLIEDDILSWTLKEDESCCSKCPANPQTIPHNETTQRHRLPVLT